MTTAYHGTPITPLTVLESLGARHFCVSYFAPQQIKDVDRLAAGYMLDNGAFSAWKLSGKRVRAGKDPIIFDAAYWLAYHEWARVWLGSRASWAVIPDVIDAGTQEQDALIREWPADLRDRGAPVWHMDEPVHRLVRLVGEWPRVCIGSTAEFAVVKSTAWRGRMDEAWDALAALGPGLPEVHMLRGMQLLLPDCDWPFASVDSTDLARNHNRLKRFGPRHLWALKQKADRWDHRDCPEAWVPRIVREPRLFAA